MDEPHGVKDWREALDALEAGIKAAEAVTVEQVVQHLVSTTEICKAWGLTQQGFSQIRTRHSETFPQPIRVFGVIQVYWGPDVDEFLWAYKSVRKPSRKQ